MRRRVWLGSLALLALCACDTERARAIDFQRWAFQDTSGDSVWGELGHLYVPVRRDRESGDSVILAIARFAATTQTPGNPIVYLEGGPGGAGIHPERMPLLMRLREFGDVITFDQRGTGRSRPQLGCGSAVELPADEPPTRERYLEAERQAARKCAALLRSEGIDLAAFNVLESVEDIEAIRTALGADQVRLVGISFGSHLGLAMLKRYGNRVERSVFAGVEGLHQTIKLPSNLDDHLTLVSELIASDSVAGAFLPDFEGLVRGTLAHLDSEPRRVAVDGDTVTLTGFEFRRLVVGSIVRRRFLRFAPEEYAPILEGDYTPIARVASTNRVSPFGMRAAMDCRSGASPMRMRRVQDERDSTLLQGVADFPFPEVCDAWGLRSLGPEVWDRFQSDGPVLFITGDLDGLTPVSNVEELRSDFPNAGHVTIRNMGHEGPGLWFGSPEVLREVGQFLAGASPRDIAFSASPIEWVLPPRGR